VKPNTIPPLALVGAKHPALHTPAVDIRTVSVQQVSVLSERMKATLVRLKGYALAACQIGRPLGLVVTRDPLAVWLNPRIVDTDGRMISEVEGCLSMPSRWYEVERFEKVTVEAFTLTGKVAHINASNLQARIWQHEYDHLQGKLISEGGWPEARRPT
jgi:peptide deformylase